MPAKKLRSCPFCNGKSAQHPNPEWREQYQVVYHEPWCWLCEDEPPYNFNLIPTCAVASWNRRANIKECARQQPTTAALQNSAVE